MPLQVSNLNTQHDCVFPLCGWGPGLLSMDNLGHVRGWQVCVVPPCFAHTRPPVAEYSLQCIQQNVELERKVSWG